MSSNETALVPQTETSTVHLVARNPVEMQASQSNLAAWLRAKIAEIGAEMQEYQDALEHATKNKWNKRGLQKAVSNAFYRQQFYEKTLAAVEAGFTIIPEFPIDIFAVRVEREGPKGSRREARYGKATAAVETADILPQGAGNYVSPTPKAIHWKEQRGEGEKAYSVDIVSPTALQPVEFPIRTARAEIMSTTAEAMALRVFDEIGICPPRRQPDPLIIGRICMPNSTKSVNFLIAWSLNLNEL